MTHVLTPVEVESEIFRLSNLLEKATTELSKRARRNAEAETDYKISFAKAMLKAQGDTVGAREAEAMLIVEDQFHTRHLTAALLQSAQEASRNYRAQLSAMQSVYRAIAEGSGLR